MYPGFSGGPTINAEGDVIGLNTSGLLRGVSLSLPAETVDRIVKTIVQHGRVRRGYLGVAGHAVRLPDATRKELAQESGVLVASVESESPASEGGLLLGDVILRLAGDKVEHLDDLISSLGPDRVGEQVAVDVLRGGRRESVRIRVGERG
jgi:S1-C subfamily serine protease